MKKRKLTSKQKKEVLAFLSVGCSRAAAARCIRISPYMLNREMSEQPQFAEDIAKAEEGIEIFFLSRIRNAAQKEQHWRAAAWVLERRFPQRYGNKKPENLTAERVQKFMTSCLQIIDEELQNKELQTRILLRLSEEMEGLEQ